jgi:hypothetical protein
MRAEINPAPIPIDIDPKKSSRNLKITMKMFWLEGFVLRDDIVLYKEIAIFIAPKQVDIKQGVRISKSNNINNFV